MEKLVRNMVFSYFFSKKSYTAQQDALDAIREMITGMGYVITHDFLEKDVLAPSSFEEINEIVINSDVCIAEVSYDSTEVGIAVAKSVELGKPTAMFYHKDLSQPKFLPDEGKYVELFSYSDNRDLKLKVLDFIELAQSQTKSRFNLVMTGKQNSKINQVKFEQKISKNQVINDAVEAKMFKDKLYSKYLELNKNLID